MKDEKYNVGADPMSDQNAITLIALTITIILLLILAGVTISMVVGENGIFKKAQIAVEKTKTAELKEKAELEAKISYASIKAEEYVEGKTIALERVISDLRSKGYTIKEIANKQSKLKELLLNTDSITLNTNSKETLYYEVIYEENEQKQYFVEIQEKYYEIYLENGVLTISDFDTIIDEKNKKTELIVETDNEEIVAAEIYEDTIKLTSKENVGNVLITLKDINNGKTATCEVTVGIPATGISISKPKSSILQKEIITLTANVVPSNTTDPISWESSDESIATIDKNGKVTGIKPGTVTISSMCGKASTDCEITVLYTWEKYPVIDNSYYSYKSESCSWEWSTSKTVYMPWSNTGNVITGEAVLTGRFSSVTGKWEGRFESSSSKYLNTVILLSQTSNTAYWIEKIEAGSSSSYKKYTGKKYTSYKVENYQRNGSSTYVGGSGPNTHTDGKVSGGYMYIKQF